MSKAWRGWRNPEFTRNLWLELSPQRLLLMPALIALSLFLTVLLGKRTVWSVTAEAIVNLSLLGFAGITIIWGARAASNALLRELLEGTWDNQRMSGLTPWQMVWGKLLGSTIYTWYGGVLLLLVAALAEASSGTPWQQIWRTGVALVCFAFLAQIISMLRVLVFRHKKTAQGTDFAGILIFLLLGFVVIMPNFSELGRADPGYTTHWWGSDWRSFDFMVCTLVPVTLWALAGLWQAMRRELLVRNRPWSWLVFLLFWLAWGGGFVYDSQTTWFEYFMMATLLVWISVYPQLVIARNDQGAWIYFLAAWRRRDFSLLQHLLPKWGISALLALVLSLVAWSLAPMDQGFFRVAMSLLNVAAFVLRDVAWILWLSLAPDARRVDAAIMVSLVVAYGLLPLLNKTLFLPVHPLLWRASDSTDVQLLFGLAAALLQTAVAVGLLLHRWRKTFG